MTKKLNLRGIIWAYHEKLQAKKPDDKCTAVLFQSGSLASVIVFISALLCDVDWITSLTLSIITFMIIALMSNATILGEGKGWCPIWYYKIFKMSPGTTYAIVLVLFILIGMMFILIPNKDDTMLLRVFFGFNTLWYLATTLYLLLTTPLNKHFPRKSNASVKQN